MGTDKGMFTVLSAENGSHIFSYQAAQTQIDSVQFSPGKLMLGVGIAQKIYVHYVSSRISGSFMLMKDPFIHEIT